MVALHAISHVPHARSAILEFVGEEGYLVTPLQETLGQLVPMSFDSTELWEGEIRANKNRVFPISIGRHPIKAPQMKPPVR